MSIPSDYPQRVYAGVLGKIIGVYLGRPFEGWSYERIMESLGEVRGYVHDRLGRLLIVTDDDISGTFTFIRALADGGFRRGLTPRDIGQTWLNYIIENRTILWWGGMGVSTEHTAFLRMLGGVEPPASGSIAVNGKVVAEQIGSQIFIDGWAMVAPGDPELAADLARRAASVSHDGEAIYGAQAVAAMEAQAFVERDVNKLLDTAASLIPRDSVIYRLISDLREWRADEPDWRKAREKLAARYGYDKFGGGCHMVPNHGVIILALLYGGDDFQHALAIANTCGWDTDCNSGNVGCLTGIRLGLEAIDAGPVDWRGPVADRLYLPTADGGRCITDAATETYHLVNAGRALAGLEPMAPKDGAKFHFTLPGSVQGFRALLPSPLGEAGRGALRESEPSGLSLNIHPGGGGGQDATGVTVRNVGARLSIRWKDLATGESAQVATDTFIPPEATAVQGYGMFASPTLYPGQTVRAAISAAAENGGPINVRLFLRHYNAQDKLTTFAAPGDKLSPGRHTVLVWRVPEVGGQPIACIGIEAGGERGGDGKVSLDYLTWDGQPEVTLGQPAGDHGGGKMWKAAWVDAVDRLQHWGDGTAYCLIQDRGRGLMIQGTREWTDYRLSATLRPHMVQAAGLAARVQGLRRYYALLLRRPGKLRLVRMLEGESVLKEIDCPWEFGREYHLALQVQGSRITGWMDDRVVVDCCDSSTALAGGGVAVVCEEGRLHCGEVGVRPAPRAASDEAPMEI